MAFDYDEFNPLNSSYIADFPASERGHRAAAVNSALVDHLAETTGFHRKVSLTPLGADPSTVLNEGFVYTKDVGGITELFYMDEDGTVTQLTDDGTASPDKLPLAGGEMVGDTTFTDADLLMEGTSLIKLLNAKYLQARNAADDAWLDLAGVDGSDVAEFGNTSGVSRINAANANSAVVAYGSGDKKIFHEGNPPSSLTLVESAAQAFSLGNSGSVGHSGGMPKLWTAVLRCISTSQSYAVGEELQIGGNPQNSPRGIFVSCTASAFKWRVGTDQAKVCNTTGGSAELVPSKWRIVFRAWFY